MTSIASIDTETFTHAVRTATSYAELCEKLGVAKSRASLTAIRRRTVALGLSLTGLARVTSPIANERLLRQVCLGAETKSDILLALGVPVNAGNYKTLEKYLQKFGLAQNAFSQGAVVGGKRAAEVLRKRQPTVAELFIADCASSRKCIKARLIRERLIPHKCASCDCGNVWNGKLLVLTLEHKNGINNDNRLENLEFLCPNCHSQTATFSGRNKRVSAGT